MLLLAQGCITSCYRTRKKNNKANTSFIWGSRWFVIIENNGWKKTFCSPRKGKLCALKSARSALRFTSLALRFLQKISTLRVVFIFQKTLPSLPTLHVGCLSQAHCRFLPQ